MAFEKVIKKSPPWKDIHSFVNKSGSLWQTETELGCRAASVDVLSQIITGYILWWFSLPACLKIELMGYFAALLNPWGQNECSLLEI